MIAEDELRSMYWDDSMSQPEIGKLCGVSQSAVHRWMRDYGIERRTVSESKLINSKKPSKEDLEEMYWGNGMSTLEIGELCGVGHVSVYNWMAEYGIEMRTMSEAMLGEKNNNWKGGISKQLYCYKFNNRFKEAVRKRDDYTCQLCGFEQNGRKLSVHHIHYDKENCYPDVVALCSACNTKVNSNRDYWENYFENQLLERGLLDWSMS